MSAQDSSNSSASKSDPGDPASPGLEAAAGAGSTSSAQPVAQRFAEQMAEQAQAAGIPPQMIAASMLEIAQGPYPPSSMLNEYERIYPGAAKMIFEGADRQAKHRQEIEKKALDYEHKRSTSGIRWAGFISIVIVVLAGFAVYKGAAWVAGVLVALDLAGIVTAFIYGTKSTRQERGERVDKMLGLRSRRVRASGRQSPNREATGEGRPRGPGSNDSASNGSA